MWRKTKERKEAAIGDGTNSSWGGGEEEGQRLNPEAYGGMAASPWEEDALKAGGEKGQRGAGPEERINKEDQQKGTKLRTSISVRGDFCEDGGIDARDPGTPRLPDQGLARSHTAIKNAGRGRKTATTPLLARSGEECWEAESESKGIWGHTLEGKRTQPGKGKKEPV